MTEKTTDFSGLLYYNPSTNGFNPIVEATMTGPTSIDEGATATFDVVAWGIPDGPVYWWVTNLTNLTTDRISPGIFAEATIDNNRSSFSVTVNANNATATAAQSYIVKFGKVNGTALASITVTVNDTSQGATGNKVISLNPNYIALQGGNNIPNEVDSGSSAAALSAPFTGTLAQNGTLNFTGQNSALLLPAKNIKTIGMWIKITVPMSGTMYLVDSRVINGSGEGTGYFYSAGFEGWTLMSINGAPADTSNWATIINNTNNWQYVTIINQTNTPHSITLFNRYTLGEGLYNLQVGWVEAWDYVLNDTQINTAYLVHRTDYTITTPNALQITVGYASQGGTPPNNTVALSGVPSGQWTAIRNASSYVGKHGDNTTFSMTYIGDDDNGTFTFGVGTESSFQADSFWYVP
jgi:hypothetical protein